ncbi:hypothetical protein RND71_005437 [Anisodus tanguticus]|uniref:Uncharacterized protein n=1 Tax=Anisodus tanguticus TaxID=243964 RepID=A0AAE1SRH7_9SOLA|nr:hypothetical protein RND71_005437 [Anisodus tanguticus]
MCYSSGDYCGDKRERGGRFVPPDEGQRGVAREQVSRVSNENGSAAAGMMKQYCVCSPTNHRGSFRCRHHHADYKWALRQV